MISITKEFSFCYGHRLYDSSLSEEENCSIYSKCAGFHGHNAILRVTVTSLDGKIPSNGMIINFDTLKEIITKYVIDKLDHKNLNELHTLPKIPTCENLILWIHSQIQPILEEYGVTCLRLQLYETPTSYVTWEKN